MAEPTFAERLGRESERWVAEGLITAEQAAARDLADVVRRHGKPFVLHTIYAGERLPALDVLRGAGVPMYRSLEASAKALAACWRATPRPRATRRAAA